MSIDQRQLAQNFVFAIWELDKSKSLQEDNSEWSALVYLHQGRLRFNFAKIPFVLADG